MKTIFLASVTALVLSAIGQPARALTAATDVYEQTVAGQNPVLYWRLGEAGGATAQNLGSLGAAGNGTYGNTVNFGGPSLVNAAGNASGDASVTLAKDTQARVLADPFPMPANDVTVSFFVQGQDNGLTHFLGYSAPSPTGSNGFTFGATGGSFRTIVQGSIQDFPGVDTLDGDPHHVALTWSQSSGNLDVWVDGAVAGSRTIGAGTPLVPGGALAIGQDFDGLSPNYNFDGGQAFSGTIDEFAIFDRVLSPSEIMAQASQAAPPTTPEQAVNLIVPDGASASLNAGSDWVVQDYLPLAGPDNDFGDGGFVGNAYLRNTNGDDDLLTLTLTDLPEHTSIDLGMVIAQIESMDPVRDGDLLTIRLDGQDLLEVGLGFGSSPPFSEPVINNPIINGMPVSDSLIEDVATLNGLTGAAIVSSAFPEHMYDFGRLAAFNNIPHTASSLTLEIIGRTNQGFGNEYYGVDQLSVTLNAVPEPTTTVLVLMGLAGAARRRRSA